MKIAVLGGGFTGLAAALKLLQNGHQVTIFEKETQVGGLATGFKNPKWDWHLDKFYHHIFADDYYLHCLAQLVGQKILKIRPKTDTYIKETILPLDSPSSLLSFPYLPLLDKLRMGLVLAYFKFLPDYKSLEGKAALPWIKKFMGKKATDLIWEPLFSGKFGKYKDEIALTWFWARIRKRSTNLYYPEGGFQEFANKIASKITNLGGIILLNTEVKDLEKLSKKFDKVIVTLPLPVFFKITPKLPKNYLKDLTSTPYLSAQVLILFLKKPFLEKSYWLNINDPNFPFLVLAEHTNFVSPKHYGENHILYIGNYLPEDHPYLKMSAKELLKKFAPYLKKINPSYHSSLITSHLFTQSFAQPITSVGYEKIIPQFKTPLKNIYLATMSMVYPWDRETNYAVELGEKVAQNIVDESE